ncbi:sensor histidine kinase [Nostoc linckia]|uniref:sensor histidine kinase n=1 Tax=Nostoc linckia TaxID=92942 RepID=UPI000BFFD255|nr:PAS domain-containing sensor histidine kinase [Nostoc linckia]
MHNTNRSWQKSYGIAVLASGLALLFSLLISPLLENITFSVFFAAVVLSSWYGTRGSSLLATLLCSLAIALFFLEPIYSLNILALDGSIRLGLFAIVSLLTTELNAAWRRTELKLRESETRYREMAEAVQNYANELEERVANRTAALLEANKELETFGYSVSHDLRAPLRSMQGFAQALQEDYSHCLDSDAQDYIQRIVASAERMDGLIQDLLDYSRLSQVEINLGVLNLTDILTEALNQLEVELRSRQAQVNIEQPLPEVTGNWTILIQVLVNLLSNAIKFVPANRQPTIRIWAEIVGGDGEIGRWGDEVKRGENSTLSPLSSLSPLSPLSSSSPIRLWIEDNGIGIAPEHRQRIFNVFERLHTQESYPGSGIGLAIVRKGVERMGGQVGVESIEGQGSRFWIQLQKFSMKT